VSRLFLLRHGSTTTTGRFCGSTEAVLTSAPDALRQFWQDPARYPPPRAEPLEAVCARVLVVTHGGPMRILRGSLNIDVPYAALWDTAIFRGPASAAIDTPSCCARS
jgi:broad specificity phosphatase PhoE